MFSTFLDILCISVHFGAVKSSILTKMGEFLLNHPNFQKISAPAAPEMGHFSPFSQFFGAEKLVTLGQNWPPFWPLAPSNSSPDRYHSLYPWHSGGDYRHLTNDKDEEMLEWVRKFK